MDNIMKTWIRRMGICAAVLAAGACLDLTVPNENQPDRTRAITSASDIEALIYTGFRAWYHVETWLYPGMAMSVAADANSSSWGNFGMRDVGSEPRVAFNNDASYSSDSVNLSPWVHLYRALAGVKDGLVALADQRDDVVEELGALETERLEVFGKVIQALCLAALSAIYDQSFIVDENTNLDSLTLEGYDSVWAAADAKFTEVIQLSRGAAWQIPEEWVAYDSDWSGARTAEVMRAFRARYAAWLARTESERASLDWSSIKSDAAQGMITAYAPYYDGNAPWRIWQAFKAYGWHPGWHRIDYRTVGPADASGAWETWINAPIDDRRPFNIDTDDRRVTGGSYDTDGAYIRYYGNSPFRPERGLYHFSHYGACHWCTLLEDQGWVGDWTILTPKELDFLEAEADYRLGDKAAAMRTVNNYRTDKGRLPPFTDVNGVAPGGSRCVPQNPDGSCGDLWEALKYEKRIELYAYGMAVEYMDDRGWGDLVQWTWQQLPIPGAELDILNMDVYTFGGPGGESSAIYLGGRNIPPDIGRLFTQITPEALRLKRRLVEALTEHNARIPDDLDVISARK